MASQPSSRHACLFVFAHRLAGIDESRVLNLKPIHLVRRPFAIAKGCVCASALDGLLKLPCVYFSPSFGSQLLLCLPAHAHTLIRTHIHTHRHTHRHRCSHRDSPIHAQAHNLNSHQRFSKTRFFFICGICSRKRQKFNER